MRRLLARPSIGETGHEVPKSGSKDKKQFISHRARYNLAGFRYTVGTGVLETFPELSDPNCVVSAINGYGEFCGRIRVPKLKGSQFVYLPFRFNPPALLSLIGNEKDQAGEVARDINDSSDVAIGRALFHNDTKTGVLNLSTLVVGSDSDIAYFLAQALGAVA